MSMFKDRSGGSMFRFKSLSGYMKILYEEHFLDGDTPPVPEPEGELKNKMIANYEVKTKEVQPVERILLVQ